MELKIYPGRVIVDDEKVLGDGWAALNLVRLKKAKNGVLIKKIPTGITIEKMKTTYPLIKTIKGIPHILVDTDGKYVPIWNTTKVTKDFKTYTDVRSKTSHTLEEILRSAPKITVKTRAQVNGTPISIIAERPDKIHAVTIIGKTFYHKKITIQDLLEYLTEKEIDLDKTWDRVIEFDEQINENTFTKYGRTFEIITVHNPTTAASPDHVAIILDYGLQYTVEDFIEYAKDLEASIQPLMKEVKCPSSHSKFRGDVLTLLERLYRAPDTVGPCIAKLRNKIITPRGIIVTEGLPEKLPEEQEETIKYVLGIENKYGLEGDETFTILLNTHGAKIETSSDNIKFYSAGKTYIVHTNYIYRSTHFTIEHNRNHDPTAETIIIGDEAPLPPKVREKILKGQKIEPEDFYPGLAGELKTQLYVEYHHDSAIALMPLKDGLYAVKIPYDVDFDPWTIEYSRQFPPKIKKEEIIPYTIHDAEVYSSSYLWQAYAFMKKGEKEIQISSETVTLYKNGKVVKEVDYKLVADALHLGNFDDAFTVILLF